MSCAMVFRMPCVISDHMSFMFDFMSNGMFDAMSKAMSDVMTDVMSYLIICSMNCSFNVQSNSFNVLRHFVFENLVEDQQTCIMS